MARSSINIDDTLGKREQKEQNKIKKIKAFFDEALDTNKEKEQYQKKNYSMLEFYLNKIFNDLEKEYNENLSILDFEFMLKFEKFSKSKHEALEILNGLFSYHFHLRYQDIPFEITEYEIYLKALSYLKQAFRFDSENNIKPVMNFENMEYNNRMDTIYKAFLLECERYFQPHKRYKEIFEKKDREIEYNFNQKMLDLCEIYDIETKNIFSKAEFTNKLKKFLTLERVNNYKKQPNF
ncbi:hypothetical protein [Campylobacter sp. JMF_08 NE1]|uniref:hypothetical protein n=1 Tax=Campylobacter sp. JMF_08 NE1 TaxID=2983821 RepID=UPI0022E9D9D1|nr:hypothetical protein [Campylobacter sp. JMF_08 NE1]MDA3048580.1 hypothetical protein [Campylobacter sp. JMF_08 NE1]